MTQEMSDGQAVRGASGSTGSTGSTMRPGPRVSTRLRALDRVLGGGLVEGSVTLLVGQPGAGKSTLTLQALDGLGRPFLYVTSEETREHVEERARRVGAMSDRICVLSTGCLEEILDQAQAMRAWSLAIDTIWMLRCEHVSGRPGFPAQLRGCASRLIDYARTTGTTLWLVGYLTGRGDIAGPKTIVHEADVVLRLDQEGDDRILGCPDKNRFGLTGVTGRLKLTTEGFIELSEEASAPVGAARGTGLTRGRAG